MANASSVPFFIREMNNMLHATVWDHPRAFNNQYKDRDYLIQYYHKWLAEVREVCTLTPCLGHAEAVPYRCRCARNQPGTSVRGMLLVCLCVHTF